MKTVWLTNYFGNEIRVENSWFGGEKLFVNSRLQDISMNLTSSKLTGHLIENEKKILIKVRLYSEWFSVKCAVFIDDKPISIERLK